MPDRGIANGMLSNTFEGSDILAIDDTAANLKILVGILEQGAFMLAAQSAAN